MNKEDFPVRLQNLSLDQVKGFFDFCDWFFHTYESTAFERGGSCLPCPQWWLHPEAVERMYMVHRLWAVAEDEDGEAVEYFWRTVDHNALHLFGPASPFHKCRKDEHKFTLEVASHRRDLPALGTSGWKAVFVLREDEADMGKHEEPEFDSGEVPDESHLVDDIDE